MPDEFQYDPVSKSYGDVTRRPEVKSSTIEFIAPSEYMVGVTCVRIRMTATFEWHPFSGKWLMLIILLLLSFFQVATTAAGNLLVPVGCVVDSSTIGLFAQCM